MLFAEASSWLANSVSSTMKSCLRAICALSAPDVAAPRCVRNSWLMRPCMRSCSNISAWAESDERHLGLRSAKPRISSKIRRRRLNVSFSSRKIRLMRVIRLSSDRLSTDCRTSVSCWGNAGTAQLQKHPMFAASLAVGQAGCRRWIPASGLTPAIFPRADSFRIFSHV